MSALLTVAAALALVGFGMLVSPEVGRIRRRLRRRREQAEAVVETGSHVDGTDSPPQLHVIHGDGGTVVPFPQRRAQALASTPSPYGVDGPDAA